MIERKVFVPVSVSERLPDKNKPAWYHVIEAGGNSYSGWWDNDFYNCSEPTHWLEEKENVYVLTEAMAKSIAVKLLLARDALVANDYNEVYHQLYSIGSPNFDKHSDDVWSELELIAGEEYTQSKTNPQTEKHG